MRSDSMHWPAEIVPFPLSVWKQFTQIKLISLHGHYVA
jgi:hypothetical protein